MCSKVLVCSTITCACDLFWENLPIRADSCFSDRYCLPFIWCIIQRFTCSGFDGIATYSALTSRMKFRENKKINNSRTTRALFRVNGVSIDSLEMD